jgi:hypothetical protein
MSRFLAPISVATLAHVGAAGFGDPADTNGRYSDQLDSVAAVPA